MRNKLWLFVDWRSPAAYSDILQTKSHSGSWRLPSFQRNRFSQNWNGYRCESTSPFQALGCAHVAQTKISQKQAGFCCLTAFRRVVYSKKIKPTVILAALKNWVAIHQKHRISVRYTCLYFAKCVCFFVLFLIIESKAPICRKYSQGCIYS